MTDTVESVKREMLEWIRTEKYPALERMLDRLIAAREDGEDFVYVGGRYGDGDDFLLIEQRVGRARSHCRQLAEVGIPFFCPLLNSAHFDRIAPGVPREFWLRQNQAFLPRAWGMYAVEWEAEQSAGLHAEMHVLTAMGRPVFMTSSFPRLVARWKEEHVA